MTTRTYFSLLLDYKTEFGDLTISLFDKNFIIIHSIGDFFVIDLIDFSLRQNILIKWDDMVYECFIDTFKKN